jgi:hypothetical protein
LGPPKRDFGKAIELYNMGIPMAEIGRRQNPPMSRQAVWNILKRRGLLKKDGGRPA